MKDENNQSLLIESVVKIRKMVSDISDETPRITELNNDIFSKIEEAGVKIALQKDLTEIWVSEKNEINSNIALIMDLLRTMSDRLQKKETAGLSTFWKEGKNYADITKVKFGEMEKMGEVIFLSKDLEQWKELWAKVREDVNELFDIAETIYTKLSMIEILRPEEIDELTKDIIKHIPLNYSLEEASEYEKEYMQAYKELKEEASKKKNLWDKFLDVLAGGIQETPAHRVMLRRWMNGEER